MIKDDFEGHSYLASPKKRIDLCMNATAREFGDTCTVYWMGLGSICMEK
jgi:hypothetical protein